MSGPHIDEGPTIAAAGLQGEAQTVSFEFSATDADRKEVATVSANLCRAGFSLHELAGGGFIVARWDRTMHCADLDAVRAFCKRAGVSV